jgi:hypothetical protein
MKYDVVDWGDGAYRTYGKEKVIATIDLPHGLRGFSYDGGRLDLAGYPQTIYVASHQFSVNEHTETEK